MNGKQKKAIQKIPLNTSQIIEIEDLETPIIEKTIKKMSLINTKTSIDFGSSKKNMVFDIKKISKNSKFRGKNDTKISRANTRATFCIPSIKKYSENDEEKLDSPKNSDFNLIIEEKKRANKNKIHNKKNRKIKLVKKKVIELDKPCFYKMKLTSDNRLYRKEFIEKVEIFNIKTNSKFDYHTLKQECFPPEKNKETFSDYLVYRIVENEILRFAFKKYQNQYQRRIELLEKLENMGYEIEDNFNNLQ